jgi:8-oxo-dGTP diphosphatase
MRRPKVGVAVIIRDRDRVLYGLRQSKHADGFWGFPGGHLEGGESFEGCAIRETEEETGLILPDATFWTAENTLFHLENKHYVVIFTIANLPKGQEARIMEPDKCVRWEWFPWTQPPTPLMPGIEQLMSKDKNPMGERL